MVDTLNSICCGKIAIKRLTKQKVSYYICIDCGTLFSKSLPNDNMVGGTNEEERNDSQNYERFFRVYSLLGDKLFLESNVLDFGCGNARFVGYLAVRGFRIWGYDKYSETHNDLPTEKMDIVTMIEVIEHLSHPFEELDQIHSLLNENGFLYIETSFTDIAVEDGIELEDFAYVNPIIGHSTIFSHKGLEMLLRRKGFKLFNKINRNTFVFQKQTENSLLWDIEEKYSDEVYGEVSEYLKNSRIK